MNAILENVTFGLRAAAIVLFAAIARCIFDPSIHHKTDEPAQ